MKRIYVAGLYSKNQQGESGNVIDVLDNMRYGIRTAVELIVDYGFYVFCPWLDFQYGLREHIPKQIYKDNSMSWLEVSDAVLVISGAGLKTGVDEEIDRANKLGIPVFYTIKGLVAAREDKRILRTIRTK